MLSTALAIVLLFTSSQEPQQKIAVVQGWPEQTVTMMTVAEAERKLATSTDPGLRAALVMALGTRPGNSAVVCVDTLSHCEVTRWYRLPAQATP